MKYVKYVVKINIAYNPVEYNDTLESGDSLVITKVTFHGVGKHAFRMPCFALV